MRGTIRIIILVLSSTALVVFYQNCGSQVEFADSLAVSDIVAIIDAPSSDNPVSIDNSVDNTTTPSVVMSPGDFPVDNLPNSENKNEDKAINDQKSPALNPHYASQPAPVDTQHSPSEISASALIYNCIIQGPGQSFRAALIDSNSGSAIQSQVSTPKTICTTVKGCEIIARVLPVKDAVFRDSCNNNPHVVHLNEQQLNQLLSQ